MQAALIVLLLAQQHTISVEKPRFDQLLERVERLPDTRPELALITTLAALSAETERFPAELLIAIAWGESRLEPATRTGKACGPMQTIAVKKNDCERWSIPIYGYQAGVDELNEWASDKRTRGDLELILRAYACGNAAFDGTCSKMKWPSWVLRRAKALGMRRNAASS